MVHEDLAAAGARATDAGAVGPATGGVPSAGQELAYGLRGNAEQDTDVARSQALRFEALSHPPRLGCGIGAEPFGLLTSTTGLAYFFGQRGIEHRDDLYLPHIILADPEVQC